MKKFKVVGLIAFISMFLVVLAGCSSTKANDPKQSINVTSSVNFYGEVAKNVLGKYGKVTSIINNPNIDPHDFNPSSSDAKNVYKANLVYSQKDGQERIYQLSDNHVSQLLGTLKTHIND